MNHRVFWRAHCHERVTVPFPARLDGLTKARETTSIHCKEPERKSSPNSEITKDFSKLVMGRSEHSCSFPLTRAISRKKPCPVFTSIAEILHRLSIWSWNPKCGQAPRRVLNCSNGAKMAGALDEVASIRPPAKDEEGNGTPSVDRVLWWNSWIWRCLDSKKAKRLALLGFHHSNS